MRIELTEQDIPTLKQELEGWTYTIKTKYGKSTGSHIASKDDAIKHAEKQVVSIITAILSK